MNGAVNNLREMSLQGVDTTLERFLTSFETLPCLKGFGTQVFWHFSRSDFEAPDPFVDLLFGNNKEILIGRCRIE